ncbi:MAG: chorismate synthase, partial [Candidatus Nitrosocaldus sp.]
MLGNMLGERLTMLTFGESHGRCVGAIVDGCPVGLPLKEEDIQRKLDLRRPGQSIVTTQRKEEDRVEILSGVFNGYTTGAPICMIIWNKDQDSRAYEQIRLKPRPGHADYPAYVKYAGYNDYRGGGRFSGRLTAALVMAGALAEKLLAYTLGIEVIAYTLEIGGIKMDSSLAIDAKRLRYSNDVRCPDPNTAELMMEAIIKARHDGDSLGGVVECIALNMPIGLGEP